MQPVTQSVVFIHLYNDRSGSPRVLLQVIKALHKAGMKVETLTSSHSGGFLDDVPGVKRNIFYRRSDNKLLTLFWYVISQIFLFLFCLGYFNKKVVFHVNTMMPFGAALAGWLIGKKVVYHVHETSIRPKYLKMILRAFISLTASHIIFVSSYLSRVESFPNKKSKVIYNALTTLPENPLRTVPQPQCFRVLMVCSLKRYKGVDEYVELARRFDSFSKDYESRVIFVLVLNADKLEVERYFKSEDKPSNLYIYTRQSDLSQFYREADLLLNLSRPDECVEAFGLTVIEAMSYGLPVMVPEKGGPAELVVNGREGLHVSCYDLAGIAGHIKRIYEDHGVYQSMSQNARICALKFSPESFDQAIVTFYHQSVLS